MSSSLNPLIAEKLEEFSQRWRRLILFRGLAEGLVTLLASVTLVAVVDRLFILPDAARYCLSALSYLATAGVVWWSCLRFLVKAPSARDMARIIEKTRPDLREDLISAVEFGEGGKEEAYWDSEIFRGLLQTSVASRMENADANQLLPGSLISRWMFGATAAALVFAFLFVLPGLRFSQLVARVMIPMADFERVSNIRIKILKPTQTEGLVPTGDNIPVLVEISGEVPSRVELETFHEGERNEHQKVAMTLVGERQYSGSISADTEAVEYRLRADTAITRKYRIETRARPHVKTFEKNYHFPDYARRAPEKVTDENGDLEALNGTVADLRLKTDQPVTYGELHLELKGRKSTNMLISISPTDFEVRVPMHSAGTYQVHLVSKETGFNNEFSPFYEINPLADLIPSAVIEAPRQDQIVQPDDVIQILGSAADDLGLTNVSLVITQPRRAPRTIVLSTEVAKELNVGYRLDLLELQATAGDQLVVKLVAWDLRGSRGESSKLNLQVSSPGFDAKRIAALQVKRSLHTSLKKLSEEAELLRKAVEDEALPAFAGADEGRKNQSAINAQAASSKMEEQLKLVRSQLGDSLAASESGREAEDMKLAARALSELQHEEFARTKSGVDKLQLGAAATETVAKAAAEDAKQTASKARALEQRFNEMLAAEEASNIVGNLNYLAREQQRINDAAKKEASSDEDAAWERLARRENAAVTETRMVEDMIESLSKNITDSQARKTEKPKKMLEESRADLEQALKADSADKDLAKPADRMRNATKSAFSGMQSLEQELSKRAENARRELARSVGRESEKVEQARKSAEALARANSDDAARGKAAEDWRAAAEQLKDAADFEERRPDADSQFVSDTAKTAQALSALRSSTAGEDQAAVEPLKTLEKAFQALEMGHELRGMAESAKQLAGQERWESGDPNASASRPKDWDRLDENMREAAKGMQKAGLPKEAVNAMNEAVRRQSTKDIDREMANRETAQRNPSAERTPTPLGEPFNELKSGLNDASRQSEPALIEARKTLAGLAPKISEMAEGLARAAERMEAATRKEQAQVPDSGSAPKSDKPAELLARQEDLGQQVDDLKAALRRDANVQDTGQQDGRATARDADDAVALLADPPAKAEDALRESARTPEAATRKQAMANAAKHQKELAARLNQLAKHFEASEKGMTEELAKSREELREAEEKLGIKSGLDEQYRKAEELAEMRNKTPEELLAQLEEDLKNDPEMQRELGLIADRELMMAYNTVQMSADREGEIAADLNESAESQKKLPDVEAQVRKLAEAAKTMADRDVPRINAESLVAGADAEEQIKAARDSLKSAADDAPKTFSQSPDRLAKQIGELSKPLELAKQNLMDVANKAGEIKRTSTPTSVEAGAAHAAQELAGEKANEAGRLAAEARKLAGDLQRQANQEQSARSEGATQQQRIQNQLLNAGNEISRAGRHESRLNTPDGKTLEQIGKDTEQVANREVLEAQKTLANQDSETEKATQAVQSAEQAMETQLAKLRELMNALPQQMAAAQPQQGQQPQQSQQGEQNQQGQPQQGQQSQQGEQNQQGQQPQQPQQGQQGQQGQQPQQGQQGEQSQQGQQGQPSGQPQATPAESKWKARTLDRLDASMNPSTQKGGDQGQQQKQQGQQNQQGQDGKPGEQSGQAQQDGQAQQAAQEAMDNAAKAQQSQMAQSRQGGKVPGQKQQQSQEGNGAGAPMIAEDMPEGELPGMVHLDEDAWARLPPKVAEALTAPKEEINGEYRAMVETYFKVITQKANGGK